MLVTTTTPPSSHLYSSSGLLRDDAREVSQERIAHEHEQRERTHLQHLGRQGRELIARQIQLLEVRLREALRQGTYLFHVLKIHNTQRQKHKNTRLTTQSFRSCAFSCPSASSSHSLHLTHTASVTHTHTHTQSISLGDSLCADHSGDLRRQFGNGITFQRQLPQLRHLSHLWWQRD